MGPSPLFWVLALALVAITLALLVIPLLRRSRTESAPAAHDATTLVFRDQKRQLDDELASGVITTAERDASLAELTRRLSTELEAPVPAAAGGSSRTSFVAALLLVACVPVTAGVLYFMLGNPGALVPQAARAAPTTDAQVDAMVDELAARLKANPEDGEGWAMLARSYRVLGRFDASALAYGEAVKRLPGQAGLLVDWAESLAQAQGRSLVGPPTELLDRALKLEPDNPKALALSGAAAMERGDRPHAIVLWTRLRGVLPPDSPQVAQLDAALARAGAAAPAPAAQAAAPAASTSSTAKGPSSAAGVKGAVAGRVELDPRLAANVAPSDTVFIFARDPDGPRMPLAVLKLTVAELPRAFELTDAMAMAPGATLSKAARIVVEARVSKSGNAMAAPGDLVGTSTAVAPGTRGISVRIDRALP